MEDSVEYHAGEDMKDGAYHQHCRTAVVDPQHANRYRAELAAFSEFFFFHSVARIMATTRKLEVLARHLNASSSAGETNAGETSATSQKEESVVLTIVGTGFSGLSAAIRCHEIAGIPYDQIRLYERGADVGGTWFFNQFPGAACDVQSYHYLPWLERVTDEYVPKKKFVR